MLRDQDPERLADIIDTLIEGQALLASSLYVELVNLGLVEPEGAARRLDALADLAASPLHRHPDIAAALGERIRDYAEGLARTPRPSGPRPEVRLRVVDGGKA